MGDQSASRALVSATVSANDGFQLTPPSLLAGATGFRPNLGLGLPPLTLGGSPSPGLSPGFQGHGPGGYGLGSAGAPPSPSSGSSPASASGGAPGGWQVLAQGATQVNFANWSFTPQVGAPAPAATFQFNLLFAGFGNRFQIGEYFAGSASLDSDALGRSYSISYGVLLGGNDLAVRGPLSFLNPQLQAGPNFANLGRRDAGAQIAANISNFINFTPVGSAMSVGIGGQIGYAYDFSTNRSAFSGSLLLQFQLQRLLGAL